MEHIILHDDFSRAYWSDCLGCTDRELLEAVSSVHSTNVELVRLYLSTRRALEAFGAAEA